MTASVRLNEQQSNTLERLAASLNRQKSDVLREALAFYASRIDKEKSNRIQSAARKTRLADKKLYDEIEGTLHDGF